MEWNKNLIRGAVTELIATFDSEEKLDLGMYAQECEFQLESGIKGLFCNGLAGEGLFMDYDEKLAVIRMAVQKAAGRVPVIGNIPELRYRDAEKLARGYIDAGVDALCVTQPHTLGYTPELLYRYFTDIAALTDLPVYVYNAPQSGNTMAPALVDRIVNAADNIIGYKDSTQDIIHLQTVMAGVREGKHFECVAGSDATIFSTLAIGGCGIISLISAIFPKPIIEICDLYFAGDIEGAFKKQTEILEIRAALKDAPFLAGYKYAAGLIGVPMGVVRNPLSDATEAQKTKIKDKLTALGLI